MLTKQRNLSTINSVTKNESLTSYMAYATILIVKKYIFINELRG